MESQPKNDCHRDRKIVAVATSKTEIHTLGNQYWQISGTGKSVELYHIDKRTGLHHLVIRLSTRNRLVQFADSNTVAGKDIWELI